MTALLEPESANVAATDSRRFSLLKNQIEHAARRLPAPITAFLHHNTLPETRELKAGSRSSQNGAL